MSPLSPIGGTRFRIVLREPMLALLLVGGII